ncbi:major facilitator superfamily domain-containing protein [Cadophora sp. MPI-SDFR-AT-0126]|nr:major facilitator superfamily domain-containing protein [Leotiomycetes sp. MPI-SDFR-AT-0126]
MEKPIPDLEHVEDEISKTDFAVSSKAMPGDVELFHHDHIVLIPTPSPDPNDPLNLPAWRKWAILILVAAYSSTAALMSSGMGAILPAVQAAYPGQKARVNDLLTYPTLFMGLGNLISMPLALTVGRRPVFLATMVIFIASGIWCTFSQSLGSHIAGRDIMSLAAGQSEALSPMMVQEIFFLHERGQKLSWFIFIQNVSIGAFFIATQYLVGARGWRWWYGVFAIINGAVLLLSILLVTETKYDRPVDASSGAVHLDFNESGLFEPGAADHKVFRVTTVANHVLEPEKFGARTWRNDVSLVRSKPQWNQIPTFYKHVLQGLCLPSIFWLLLLNGAFLGLYIFCAGTFAPVLLAPPYGLAFDSLGFVQGAQIIVCLVFLPTLGYGSDLVIKYMSKRHGGIFKPEYRLILLVFPAAVGVISAVIYGQAAQYPGKWHWPSIAVSYSAVFFGFLGANIVGITYAIESFPASRSASLLVVICAGRGLISFALSYATLPSIEAVGYDGAMNIESSICAALSLIGIGIYFAGPALRRLGHQWFGMEFPEGGHPNVV